MSESFLILLFSVLIIPILMLVFGLLWKKHPPSSPNWIYGYRSKRAMKNQTTWNFTHAYQAKVWRWIGGGLMVLGTVFSVKYQGKGQSILSWFLYLELAVFFATILLTEFMLRRKFNDNGRYREKEY